MEYYDNDPDKNDMQPPVIKSSWDDLLEGVNSAGDLQRHKLTLQRRFLDLIRDNQKPTKPPLELRVHETVVVNSTYKRMLVSYNVEADERAHAYIAIPLDCDKPMPAIAVLHETYKNGKECAAGLEGNSDYAYLDHLARRGYVIIAPDHFVAGHRTPEKGAYDTAGFYKKHPEWTAMGKATYENSIAIDVLQSIKEVEPNKIGAMGHSLGGTETLFLSAYDLRIKAAASNDGIYTFRHNPDVLELARDHWYIYFKHIRQDLLNGKLPSIDMHEIVALVSPRPFLKAFALNDGLYLKQKQMVMMYMKVMDVYELDKKMENFAFYTHGQGHSCQHDARELIYAWMDKHLKPISATETRLIQ